MKKKRIKLWGITVKIRCFTCYKRNEIKTRVTLPDTVLGHIQEKYCEHCGASFNKEFDLMDLIKRIIYFESGVLQT